jgi:hypothetical protein
MSKMKALENHGNFDNLRDAFLGSIWLGYPTAPSIVPQCRMIILPPPVVKQCRRHPTAICAWSPFEERESLPHIGRASQFISCWLAFLLGDEPQCVET